MYRHRQHRATSAKKRASMLWNLAEAQRKQGKLPQAEQSVRQAIALVSELKGQEIEQYGECLELLAGVPRSCVAPRSPWLPSR